MEDSEDEDGPDDLCDMRADDDDDDEGDEMDTGSGGAASSLRRLPSSASQGHEAASSGTSVAQGCRTRSQAS